jgi:ABC-2 type transport system permease protein
MVTALTYQFQGWLASLMNNPRRRRTVIVVLTATFVLVVQLPNMLNFLAPWGLQGRVNRSATFGKELAKLTQAAKAQEFDAIEHARRQNELLQRHRLATQQADREWEHAAQLVNLVLPVGWLPLGVMSAAEGHVMPSILGLSGMMLIGTASLWRAYRTTIGQYQANSTGAKGRQMPAVAAPAYTRKPGGLLLEARLPGLSEPVAAIALGGLRSLLRAPEAKMMFLTPLIMVPIFGSMVLRGGHAIPESIRPLVAIGAMVLLLFGVLQLMGNQFGFDRDGFRVFVLSAARRRDILLGKNLAFAPLVLGMAAILLPIVQWISPLRMDHLLAMIPQYVSMFLLFCTLANLLSILAPVHVAAGALKASNPELSTALLQLAMFMILFPLIQGVTLLPLGIEALLKLLGWMEGTPICLLLTLAECAAVVILYRVSLVWLGELLQAREQRILESVTSRES